MREVHRAYSLLGLFGVYMLRYMETRGKRIHQTSDRNHEMLQRSKLTKETRVAYWLPPRIILQSPSTSGFLQIPSEVFFQAQPHPPDISIR